MIWHYFCRVPTSLAHSNNMRQCKQINIRGSSLCHIPREVNTYTSAHLCTSLHVVLFSPSVHQFTCGTFQPICAPVYMWYLSAHLCISVHVVHFSPSVHQCTCGTLQPICASGITSLGIILFCFRLYFLILINVHSTWINK